MARPLPTDVRESLESARAAQSELEALAYRSNLLASDRAIVNFGGGNTSVKTREPDHAGREIDRCSGSRARAATSRRSTPDGFTGLRLDEILPLAERDAMTDEEMVAYLARCQLDPTMPRASIETLLHAFVPHRARRPHPPGCDRRDRRHGRRRAARRGVLRRRRGLDPVHPPGLRALEAGRGRRRRAPGGDGRPARQARPRHLGRDRRRVVRGDARRDQPRRGVRRRAHGNGCAPFGGAARRAARPEPSASELLAARPAGATRRGVRRRPADPAGRHLAGGARVRVRERIRRSSRRSAPHAPTTSCTRGACRCGSTSTRVRSGADVLRERIAQRVADWQRARARVLRALPQPDDRLSDPSPRVDPDPGRRPRLGRADAEGRAARARPLPPRDQRHAVGAPRSAASSRSTTRSRSRSSTGRSSSTSCRSRRRRASCRARSR